METLNYNHCHSNPVAKLMYFWSSGPLQPAGLKLYCKQGVTIHNNPHVHSTRALSITQYVVSKHHQSYAALGTVWTMGMTVMVMMMAKQKNASAWTAAGSLRAWLIAGSSSDRCLLPRLRVARCDRFETKNVAQRRRRPDLEGSPLSHPPSVSLAKHTARPPATSEATATSAGRTTALMWWGSVLWKVKLARVCWVKWRRFVAASQNAPPYMPASNRHGSGAYRTLGWPAWGGATRLLEVAVGG